MRLALGLRNGAVNEHPPQQRADQARPKHRFAKDGDVPVVVLHGRRDLDAGASSRNRLMTLETALQGERMARVSAERALTEALGNVQSLRTQLAHAEFAHREGLSAAQATLAEAQEALKIATAQKTASEAAMAELLKVEHVKIEQAKPHVTKSQHTARVPRKPAVKARDAKPVKWWLPGFRAHAGKGLQEA